MWDSSACIPLNHNSLFQQEILNRILKHSEKLKTRQFASAHTYMMCTYLYSRLFVVFFSMALRLFEWSFNYEMNPWNEGFMNTTNRQTLLHTKFHSAQPDTKIISGCVNCDCKRGRKKILIDFQIQLKVVWNQTAFVWKLSTDITIFRTRHKVSFSGKKLKTS